MNDKYALALDEILVRTTKSYITLRKGDTITVIEERHLTGDVVVMFNGGEGGTYHVSFLNQFTKM